MFTGIVQHVGKVIKADKKKGSLFLSVEKPKKWRLKKGESILVNGVCLSVTKVKPALFTSELMPETLRRTVFGKKVPKRVNLERPLTPKSFIGGHIVLGHVDAAAKIIKADKESYFFSFPQKYSRLVVEKGSVALDGVSLTIAGRSKSGFYVSLTDYTLQNTTLGEKRVDDLVNIEFDILAKYVCGKRVAKKDWAELKK